MGYTTTFTGELKLDCEPTIAMVRKITQLEGTDSRNVGLTAEWYYIDLEINGLMDGVKWNGAEKSYGMVEQVNWLIEQVQKEFPQFKLKGEMHAQGEEADDRWILRIVDGKAVRVENNPTGIKCQCPSCGKTFYQETK